MSLKHAKGASRPITPVGNHVARLAQVIDLGTQQDKTYGPRHKIRLTWELSEEGADFGRGESEPFLISRVLGFTFAKKSILKKVLEGMKGRPLKEDEIDNLDVTLKELIGTPCLVNVTHAEVGDATYANVETISPLPAKLSKGVPPLRNKPIFFETEMGSESEEFLALPDFLKSQIAKSEEWSKRGAVQPDEDDDEGQQLLNFG